MKIADKYKFISSDFNGFQPLPTILQLNKTDNKFEFNEKKSGIYFWTVAFDNNEYRLYVGKTTNINNRIKNYRSDFQIFSTNDFKIRAFDIFLKKELQEELIAYKVYFKEMKTEFLISEENNLIQNHSWILNNTLGKIKISNEEFKEVYVKYYCEYIKIKLKVNE